MWDNVFKIKVKKKMNKKHYLIYQIINTVNNKIYIGKHITENVDDDYFGSGKYLKRAQKKHGLDKFVKTILFELQNEEEMNLLEKMVVTQEFCDREDTYNINVGGDGGWNYCNRTGHRVSIENQPKDCHAIGIKARQTILSMPQEKQDAIHQKISKKVKLHNLLFGPNWCGRSHTEETKIKMSKSHQGKHDGKLNSQYGTMWICNDETHESKKISKSATIPSGWRKGRFCK